MIGLAYTYSMALRVVWCENSLSKQISEGASLQSFSVLLLMSNQLIAFVNRTADPSMNCVFL